MMYQRTSSGQESSSQTDELSPIAPFNLRLASTAAALKVLAMVVATVARGT